MVFPVPVASSKSDWVFSVAGNVVNPKRAKLNPEKVEDLELVDCPTQLTLDIWIFQLWSMTNISEKNERTQARHLLLYD